MTMVDLMICGWKKRTGVKKTHQHFIWQPGDLTNKTHGFPSQLHNWFGTSTKTKLRSIISEPSAIRPFRRPTAGNRMIFLGLVIFFMKNHALKNNE
jgi:hypothetical protein